MEQSGDQDGKFTTWLTGGRDDVDPPDKTLTTVISYSEPILKSLYVTENRKARLANASEVGHKANNCTE